MKKLSFVLLVILVTLISFSHASHAFVIVGDTTRSTSNLGNFSADFNYSNVGDNSLAITVAIRNTSPAGTEGSLTGFVFNSPLGTSVTGVSFVADSVYPDFQLLDAPDSINGQPFGLFDIGTSTGGNNFQGPGSPAQGISIGQIGNFTFTLNGSGFATLSDSDFIDAMSVLPSGADGQDFFVARFNGFNTGAGSDKVPGMVGENPPPVPEPATMAMLGMGVLGLFGLRKRS